MPNHEIAMREGWSREGSILFYTRNKDEELGYLVSFGDDGCHEPFPSCSATSTSTMDIVH